MITLKLQFGFVKCLYLFTLVRIIIVALNCWCIQRKITRMVHI